MYSYSDGSTLSTGNKNETYISSNKGLPSAANRIAYSTVENNEISLKTMPWVKVISIVTKFEQNFGIWNCEI